MQQDNLVICTKALAPGPRPQEPEPTEPQGTLQDTEPPAPVEQAASSAPASFWQRLLGDR